jgi:Flp pilus assembly pilin Flp
MKAAVIVSTARPAAPTQRSQFMKRFQLSAIIPTNGFKKLRTDDRGATLLEYIMLAGLVAIAAFAGFHTFGQNVQTKINDAAGSVDNINTTASP